MDETNVNIPLMIIYVKNMVSKRCLLKVIEELNNLSISYTSVKMGAIESNALISNTSINNLRLNLLKWFRLIRGQRGCTCGANKKCCHRYA